MSDEPVKCAACGQVATKGVNLEFSLGDGNPDGDFEMMVRLCDRCGGLVGPHCGWEAGMFGVEFAEPCQFFVTRRYPGEGVRDSDLSW